MVCEASDRTRRKPSSTTERKGRPVRGLDAADFRLFENASPQSIRYFSSNTDEPVSIAFLLDVSGSMRQLDKLEHAKEGIRHIVDGLRPGDQFALICFADDQVAWITEFTSDRWNFLRRLGVQEGYGQTALNDAIAATPGLVDAGIKGRKAIVLITDGVDNHSRLSIEEAVETVGELECLRALLLKGQRIAGQLGGHRRRIRGTRQPALALQLPAQARIQRAQLRGVNVELQVELVTGAPVDLDPVRPGGKMQRLGDQLPGTPFYAAVRAHRVAAQAAAQFGDLRTQGQCLYPLWT